MLGNIFITKYIYHLKHQNMASLTPFTGLLGDVNSAHLLRRATFNPNQAAVNQFAGYTIQQAITALFAPLSLNVQEPLDTATNQPFIPTFNNPTASNSGASVNDRIVPVAWFLREARLSNTFHFKSAFWLHTMFTINCDSVLMYNFFDYLQLLNFYSDKSLQDFSKKISRSAAMLTYLDNDENTKNAPNENYAREFLELFTILKGPQDGPGSYTNYTEQDVQAAAKVLTGFTITGFRMNFIDSVCKVPLGTKIFNNHDTTNKTFSSKFNNQVINGATNAAGMDVELDTFIDMVFAQPATALNFARRMYRYYVKANITAEVETGIIVPLANNLLTTNYDISSTLKLLLSSKHFFDAEDSVQYDQIIGGKIKSPIELFLQLLSQFEITTADPSTNTSHNYRFYYDMTLRLKNIGMDIFKPLSVVGYIPIYQHPYDNLWINTAILRSRYNANISTLISGFSYNGFITKLNTVFFVSNSGHFSNPANATILVDEMLNLLLAVMPTGSRYSYFTQSLLGGLSVYSWQSEWNNYVSTNNNTAVKIALDRFVNAIVKSVEYQVF